MLRSLLVALAFGLASLAPHIAVAAEQPEGRSLEERPVDEAPPSYEVAGPILTVLGAGGLVAGVSIAAWALGHSYCATDAPCEWQIEAYSWGGMGIAGVVGGLGLGFGLMMWRDSIVGAGSHEGPIANPAILGSGIALTALGGVGVLGGVIISTTPVDVNGNGSRRGTAHPAGPVAMIVGATSLAFGLPMTVLGSRRQKERAWPVVSPVIGAGSFGLSGHF